MNVYLEIFGYIGTALVLVSMAMTSITKLRVINLAGSVVSMIYAVFCSAWPVVLLNFGLALINIIKLSRMAHEKRMAKARKEEMNARN